MIELQLTPQQAAAVADILEKAINLADQSPNLAPFIGIDRATREQALSVKNKMKSL